MIKNCFLCLFILNRRIISLIAQNIETLEDICKTAGIKAQIDSSSFYLCNYKKKLDQNQLKSEFSKDDLYYLTIDNEDAVECMKYLQLILDKDRPYEHKNLTFAEKQLVDDRTHQHYNTQIHSTTQIVLRIRGGVDVPLKFSDVERTDTIEDFKFREMKSETTVLLRKRSIAPVNPAFNDCRWKIGIQNLSQSQ
ncbi:MAG: hypothetical protein EZS28_001971 [Streblomastix strix]|uniref:Ubiquitin-like domain-containing protein n=1 Tax=Streblomastix strix TaxID=222440 RepID=A0A5J4X7A3_9EUKA|nr:MAG: hypothetical protein EZS28_001971 [Streblomastix strix]